MKKLQRKYLMVSVIIILISFGIAIVFINNNIGYENINSNSNSNLTTISDVSDLQNNSEKLTWDELDIILKNSISKIDNMTKKESEEFLRNEIENYQNSKKNIELYKDDEYKEYISDAEKLLAIAHPQEALLVNISRKKANEMNVYYYGMASSQDSGDAFRHGCWNAYMTIMMDEIYAKMFADAHEDTPNSVGIDKEMDLYNNEIGREDGLANKGNSYEYIAEVIMKRVSFGYYKKIVDGELVAPDFQNLKGEFSFKYTEQQDGTLRIDKPLLIANDSYTIPKSIDGKIVSEIGANSFKGMEISGLLFDKYSEVKSIGIYAFNSCQNLSAVVCPSSLEKIDPFAFYDCGDIVVRYHENSKLHTIGGYAFAETRFAIKPIIPPSVTFIGVGAFTLTEKDDFVNSIIIPSTLTKIEIGAFNGYKATFYAEATSRPSSWSSGWNNTNRPVIWGCNLSADKNYVISVNKTSTSIINSNAVNGISKPYRSGYKFDGWYTTADFSGTQYMDITAAPNGLLYAKWTDSCVVEGTMITLADGSQKAVEELTGNEMLLVWNLKTGSFDSAPILFIDHDDSSMFEVINLSFSDGTTVKIISEHAFWDLDLNQYVFLRNDAFKYIGHWFNKQTNDADGNMTWNKVQLVGVEVTQEYTSAWSPVTAEHLCYYVNGMLSMPGATTGLINIFDVNPDTMKIDEVAYLADIEKYGLFTYEEFKEIVYISEDMFNAFNGQYLKIAIGKGLITIDEIKELIARYSL